jgi:hypothetical protein
VTRIDDPTAPQSGDRPGSSSYSEGHDRGRLSDPPEGRNPGTWADATPAEVRAALAPESAAEFDRHWREALARAADTYDLSLVHTCLDAWRRVARVTASAGGPEGYRALRATASMALEERQPGQVRAAWREVRVGLGL